MVITINEVGGKLSNLKNREYNISFFIDDVYCFPITVKYYDVTKYEAGQIIKTI